MCEQKKFARRCKFSQKIWTKMWTHNGRNWSFWFIIFLAFCCSILFLFLFIFFLKLGSIFISFVCSFFFQFILRRANSSIFCSKIVQNFFNLKKFWTNFEEILKVDGCREFERILNQKFPKKRILAKMNKIWTKFERKMKNSENW